MAIIRPFKAYRPVKEYVKDIAALPYDVMSSKEAREIVKNNKYSFLRVDRAEVNLAESVGEYDKVVYDTANQVLENMIEKGLYIQEKTPAIYIYQQIMDGRGQKGIVCCTSVDDYINNIIKKHERTRLLKEIDRVFLYKDFFLLITNEKKLLVLKTVGVETEELIKIIKEADILFEKREEPFNIYEYCKK